jgi:hypothetical protein
MHEKAFESHLTGKSHAKKVKALNAGNNEIEMKEADGGEADSSATTNGGAAAAAVRKPLKPAANNGTSVQFRCDICNINLVSEQQLEMHVGGKKHQKKLAKPNNSNSSKKLITLKITK